MLIGIAGAANYCCEKTTGGAFCQNVNDKSQCDTTSTCGTGSNAHPCKSLSTFCASTSFCSPGTCVNQQEGTCMPSTQAVCQQNNGFWSPKKKSELPQCQLGCCLTGDQAFFVTSVACTKYEKDTGVKTNYQSSINNELSCLANANPQAKGACVYTKNYQATCAMTTKKDCQNMSKSTAQTGVSFHEGYLCSAQELGTVCGKTSKTICGDDDKVYFVDSCDNLANIYDSSKINDENYWTKLQAPTCDDKKGNKNSASCGVCDYYSGSMCKAKKTGDSVDYGNNLCKDLDCKDYRGYYSGSPTGYATATNYPKHGETWCATDSTTGDKNSPGATDFKMMCYNGDVTNDQCDPTKQQVCLESTDSKSKFKTANCKANVWGDCWAQSSKENCEDVNVRDCKWASSYGFNFTSDGRGMINTGSSGICVPKDYPGSYHGESKDPNVTESCKRATSVCYVKMEKPIFGSWTCNSGNPNNNCSCLSSSWKNNVNNICTQLGDCGLKKNYLNKDGFSYEPVSIQTGSTG